jgi:HK97 family phage portal protein
MKLQTGILSEVLAEQRQTAPAEQRSFIDIASPDALTFELFGAGQSDAGVHVSELTALGVSTVQICVDLISQSIASQPAYIYERMIVKGRQVRNIAYDHNLYDLIHFEPNPDMTSYTWRRTMAVSFLLFGNSYSEIFRDGNANATAIWPCSPYTTHPFIVAQTITLPPEPWRPLPVTLQAGTMAFKTTGVADDPTQIGRERIIAPDDMIHIPGLSFNGRMGERFVHLARPTIGKAIALGRFGNKFFSNYATPSGILEVPGKPEEREKARQSWIQRQGADGSHSVAVVPNGVKFTPMSISPEASQMLQTAQFIKAETAGLFHVPVTMLGDVDKGKANAEQLAVEYLSYCLSPWFEAMRQEFKRKLFPNPDFVGIGRRPAKNNFYIDFDTHNLLRPTAADQQAFYVAGFNTGTLSPNDIRELMGKNPREDEAGDTYYIPVNVQDAQNPVVTPPTPGNDPTDEDNDPPLNTETNSLSRIYSGLFRDAFGRAMSRDKADPKIFQPIIYAIADALCLDHDPNRRNVHDPIPATIIKFANDYIGGLFKRKHEWNQGNADEQSARELDRAISALRTAVTYLTPLKPKEVINA